MRLALFDLDDTLLDGDCSDRGNLIKINYQVHFLMLIVFVFIKAIE